MYLNIFRSTRHFGPLAFYLTWHDSIDNLMLEMVQTGIIREAVLLMSLRQAIKEDLVNGEESTALVSEVRWILMYGNGVHFMIIFFNFHEITTYSHFIFLYWQFSLLLTLFFLLIKNTDLTRVCNVILLLILLKSIIHHTILHFNSNIKIFDILISRYYQLVYN